MVQQRKKRGDKVRESIIETVRKHPADLVNVISTRFGISRQAVSRYIKELVLNGLLEATGSTRARRYLLKTLDYRVFSASLVGLEEERLWGTEARAAFNELPSNVVNIWHYAFTEMVNNAIDHSEGTRVTVAIQRNAFDVEMRVYDDGIGIFRKIKESSKLEDERHAILELAKGKFTTDPDSHTGEGIFFTSRMLDDFAILSGGSHFSHRHELSHDWILIDSGTNLGTSVHMRLNNRSKRTTKEVFDHFAADPDDYGFTKTIIPVHLATYGQDNVVSRSQAKRLLAGVDKFKTVILDFEGVEFIGQAFADEVFRVFARNNPGMLVLSVNVPEQVQRMIDHARAANSGTNAHQTEPPDTHQ